MRYEIDPGRKVETVTMLDNIVYSTVKDLNGNNLDLELSVMSAMDNAEMGAALGRVDPMANLVKKPAIVWFNGGSWRGVDKNSQIGELTFLAKAGYVVVCVYYRSITQGHFPAQIIDCKTAIRFLRANANKYSIDPERIAVMGRSEGGQLAAMLGMNNGKDLGTEYLEYSSEVAAVWDMFGPADFKIMAEEHIAELAAGKRASNRWDTILETAEGAVLGGPEETLVARAQYFSPRWNTTDNMAPMLIMHGDADPLINLQMNEDFYKAIVEAGHEDICDFYVLHNAGHGTAEFFQEETEQIALDFFAKWLK